MVSLRVVRIPRHRIILNLFFLAFIVFLGCYFAFQPQKEKEFQTLSQSVTDSFRMAVMNRQNHPLLAATRRNLGKTTAETTASAFCVVDPAITECNTMGFAAFVLYTLDYITICSALGIDQAAVFWRACNSVCSRDPTVNSWEWYFEPVNNGLESKVENVLCPLWITSGIEDLLGLRVIVDESFKNRTDVDGYESSKIITTQERMRVNKLIQQYVKPNSRIKERVEVFYRRFLAGFTVLGIHVRGTDHWRETSEQRLPSLMSWVKRARSILETLPRPRKIFIASDNYEAIQTLVSYFGKENVVFTKAVRAKRYHDEIPPHAPDFKHNAAVQHERELGTQVLIDILLLAKCDHFLHTESSVASLASYFNPHMTSYFMQEDKKPGEDQDKVRQRERDDESREMEDQMREDLDDIFECFQNNHLGSACPNIAKGIFVNFEQVQRFLHPKN